ncbi:transcription-repair coupling factor [Haloimpatiens lingqiaonensis]|uniref:transcription-repair coupling factor n=1 Tax=Haloimpatiens lingqiaonensis TaxID=1380675 RepID=UPI0010FDC89F|nr:transcription-repair coupling factor [Haloimpatiens lingqiaonensis]
MKLQGLMKPLMENKKFKDIVQNIETEKGPIEIYGVADSSRSYLINGIYSELNRNILILTHSDIEARNLYEDISFYTNNAYYFPVKETVFYNIYALSGDLRWERLKVIREMLRRGKKIIITTVEALTSLYTPIELFKKYTLKYSTGSNVELDTLIKKLVESGYERTPSVDGKGQFSIRGGIVDIYPPIASSPYRIELFGDEIDSIRTFNLETQRSIEKVNSIEIFPAKEVILTPEDLDRGYKGILEDLEKAKGNFNGKELKDNLQNLIKATNKNLEYLKETWKFDNIESFIPYFYEKKASLLDYINEPFIILDDAKRCIGKLDSVYFEFEEDYKNFFQRASILSRQWDLLFSKEETIQRLKNNLFITIDSIKKPNDTIKYIKEVDFVAVTLSNYHGQLELLIDDIKDKKSKGYATVILSGTKTRGQRLVNTLREMGIESFYSEELEEIKVSQVVITSGSLLKGFQADEIKLCVISDKEVFGESKRKLKKKQVKGKGVSKIKSFSELRLGDYVVHANHGIGIYKGIKHLDVQGHKRDYLELEYDKDDKLYVPVEQLDLVQKYIGSEGKAPKINKLSSNEWNKTKNKVKKSINDIAEELIKLYAIRSTVKGNKYGKDTVWQKQFEEEFPFEETPDQLTAIEDIKGDLESNKPMDRLLCGDVGYGKTEVALRAAFKVVMEGKQVAFLVPTTILAEQHYNNIIKRFSDFPIKIDMISRFRTSAQQKNTLKSVKEGNVDILIGTHRILQKDVKFKDLGILIIDEEQRFGVTHKEKIKEMKKNIDVLTLTATPIPRTLHMSLTGVRDISVIETPPEDRYPVQTYVVEFNEQLMRDAIIKEISRDGQVFFVYNRVKNIKDMAGYLSKLVPEASIGIAHGQMTERELEQVMMDFMDGKINLLICTTIIETGIDIQNVNTMIIYDADKMGLSQLYQLRGRVGRSNKIAYAYFTYRKDKALTEVAEKRLKAIKDFTELGSGFKIAMRDLEIRGAGNMMGSAQHGHMAAVGYDLYCRMLEETVRQLKGHIEKEKVETDIKVNVDAYISGTYIKDETQKIEIYKKIAAIDSYDDMLDVQEEIEDRYSDIPEAVNNLIDISYSRALGSKCGIEEIVDEKDELVFRFHNKTYFNQKLVRNVMDKYGKDILFKIGEKPAVAYKLKGVKREKIVKIMKEMVEFISKLVEKD